jgi:Xaa-Pro aminopeptidase
MSAARADRLAALLPERELDALLVTNVLNVRYLTGFTGTNAACVVGAEQRDFTTDFRYLEQAAEQVEGFERLRGRQDLAAELVERAKAAGRRRLGFEDQHVSVRQHRRLAELAGEEVELVPAGGLVERLRAVKDAEELRAIVRAAVMADSIYEHVLERGLVGRTEREVALDLEQQMRERGAEGPSFASIVAGGAHGALPHAEPRDVPIERGTMVVLDIGCHVDGYCSDCTRTIATGEPAGAMREVYELVLDAQLAALAAVRAGVDCRAVDAVARERIAAAGHGERFGHGLGHGVGMEVHEAPRVSHLSTDGELVSGNVVTVEPGVYLPGEFGVRIEDLVLVRDAGCDVLSGFPKDLTVAD